MRQRITYLIENVEDFNPSNLVVNRDEFSIQAVNGAKEHRITFTLSELPQELYKVLKQCHELHIRWAAQTPYQTTDPFLSHVSPGLHAFFTPHKKASADLICPLFKKIFSDDLKCDSPKDTFIGVPVLSERFSMASSYQYYQLLPSAMELVTYIKEKICPNSDSYCKDQATAMLSAGYIDIDFDSISHTLVLNIFWDKAPSGTWDEKISKSHPSDTIEIGVLNREKAADAEQLSLGGFLTVLGQDDKPKPTLFSFPSRHHTLPEDAALSYNTTFKSPTGLHPTLQITFDSPPKQPLSLSSNCGLHTYLTLPSTLFIDKYQLSDSLFLSSHNLHQLLSLSGETDLEAPDWVINKWGSSALLRLATPSDKELQSHKQQPWTVTVPMHLRYLPPRVGKDGRTPLNVPWPVVFWACPADEGTKMAVNPFDRINLGYDALFGPKTMFYHVPPFGVGAANPRELITTIQVPVLDLSRSGYVEWGTVAAVLLGCAWVCLKLFGVLMRRNRIDKDSLGKKE